MPADLNRAQDTPVATNKLMEIQPINWHRYPPPVQDATPAHVPVMAYSGGVRGDDIDTATATLAYGTNTRENGTPDSPTTYSPKTQAEKATQLGVGMAKDIGTPRGWIDPGEPYGPPPVSPTDDPTITSIAPTTAPAGLATLVTITGTKFTPWSQVEAGNVLTPYGKYVSPTKMIMTIDPRSIAGVIDIKVIDHGVKSAAASFTITAPLADEPEEE